jgi:hypothetical protein
MHGDLESEGSSEQGKQNKGPDQIRAEHNTAQHMNDLTTTAEGLGIYWTRHMDWVVVYSIYRW